MSGIDLSIHVEDIRRILWAKFELPAHVDRNDVLQDVCLRIHKANTTGSPYDPSRASLSHYIYIQILSTIRNKYRKAQRDPITYAEDESHVDETPLPDQMADFLNAFDRFLRGTAPVQHRQVYRLTREGCKANIIGRVLGLSTKEVENIQHLITTTAQVINGVSTRCTTGRMVSLII